ncbi:MAG: hypothetical protein ACPGYY_03185 [Bacteroidia bacterium]
MMFLQEVSQKLPGSAPDSGFGFWFLSQVVVTLIIFIGVYFILKPMFNKKDKEGEEET